MNNSDYSNGSVRYPALLSLGGIHKYLFDWNGISVQKPNSVVYTQENSANTEDLAKKYEIVFSEDSIEQYLYLMENPIIKVLILFASFGILILYMRRKKRKNGS